MAVIALVLYLVWFAIAFGIRAVVHRRRTGDAGFRGLSGRPGSAAWWAGVLFVLAIVTGLISPIAALLGLDSLPNLATRPVQLAGLALALAGMAATFAAQAAMGASWRVGVDPAERTGLVTAGAFSRVRNPIFSAMVLTAAGLTLMVPNVVGLSGLIALIVAIQLQVRIVEEPYLLDVHAADYRSYAAQAGRFVPGIGRITV
ncbi:MAG TPA: isoprenylcysteine carboxylmethyltransferase family protein [Kribbella sp.]|uniref:methyltransferase family protein n=1 Tax=Kribbella sp. TaxID=1871183 RepID=UPI002D79D0DE|nr:isoprenylcysteine carboxylmethyltransferase family protein [Kribbella sp.]HET6294668.1 isoprenylcysteine carboxylmethyltransferase family protein [Kribbella sp.]